ncbi:hypothetical protein BKA93DRAFT_732544 [Sparassis latifolia]
MPNPYTPLAWLPPATANDFEGSRYLYVATLSAFIWDWMMAWPDEYRIIIKAPIRLSNIIYCISRIGAFAYILTSTIFQIASVGSCQALQVALGSCFTVGVPATSALFYLRVCAVFHNSRLIMVIFGVLWLSILGTSFTVPFAISGTHIGTTDKCINSSVKSYSSAAVITTTVNDTLVFLFISVRLVSFSMQGNGIGDRLRSFTRGDGLPKISKMLLQGGQLYYFVTVALNILTMAMILSPSVSPVFRAMFTIPNVALENAMATRVFRAVHLGLISHGDTSSHSSGPSRGPVFMNHASRGGVSASRGVGRDVYPLETRVFDHATLGNHIEITKTLETHRDIDDLPAKRESLTDVESGLGQV